MKVLVIRYGAFGDSIIISALLRTLKQDGCEVFLHTSERGLMVNEVNPNVDHFIPYESNSIPLDDLPAFWMQLAHELEVDAIINLTESIERKLCRIEVLKEEFDKPVSEIFESCNKNYYEETIRHIEDNFTIDMLKPEVHFKGSWEKAAKKHLDWDKFNILFCLVGSGLQKMYPWTPLIVNELYKRYGDTVNILTVGDERGKEIESLMDDRTIKLSGEIHIMESMAITKYANLVVSPDTGILHASGCFKTPKIGLLGHTTIENITKHFENDYSIEASCECSPCFKIVNDMRKTCPIDPKTGACMCMRQGIDPNDVLDKVETLYTKWKVRKHGR